MRSEPRDKWFVIEHEHDRVVGHAAVGDPDPLEGCALAPEIPAPFLECGLQQVGVTPPWGATYRTHWFLFTHSSMLTCLLRCEALVCANLISVRFSHRESPGVALWIATKIADALDPRSRRVPSRRRSPECRSRLTAGPPPRTLLGAAWT